MSDQRAAAKLALWLLKRHWRPSSVVVLACVTLAGMLTRFSLLNNIRPWSLVTLAIVALAAGFIRWQSRGWSQWVRRLPMDPSRVCSTQLLWLIVLTLPALLSVCWLTDDAGSRWVVLARSFAWLISIAAILVAPGGGTDRIIAAGGLVYWLFCIEIPWVTLAIGPGEAVVHDLALAAVTLCHVLFGVDSVRKGGISATFMMVGLVLICWPSAGLPISCAGMIFIGVLTFDRARPGRIGGYIFLIYAAITLAIVAVVVWWLWGRGQALVSWLGKSSIPDRLEVVATAGADLLALPEGLMGALMLGWMVVLVAGELRRNRVVERWLRRRALLERMPLTRGQVAAQVLVPQLKIVATHGILVLGMGLVAWWTDRALELDASVLMWQRGTAILAAGLAYFLVAQLFIFHRGLVRWPRDMGLILAVIAMLLSLSHRTWPFILAVSVSTIAVTVVALIATLWVMRSTAGSRGPLVRHT